jgi:hypothetical protein
MKNYDTTDSPFWQEPEEENEYDPADRFDMEYSQKKLDRDENR